MPSTIQGELTSTILKDTHAPTKINHPWHGVQIWNRLVGEEDKETNESKLQEILVQPNEKDKKFPPELRNKRRPLDVSVKVWKELVKAYDKADARRKSDKESTQVF